MDDLINSEDYTPPRNALTELFANAPLEIIEAMHETLRKIRKTDADSTWPDEPYHYGMGRIMAYDHWLDSLSEEDREQEITACRERYELHLDDEATQLKDAMKALGFDLEKLSTSHEHEKILASDTASNRSAEISNGTNKLRQVLRPTMNLRARGLEREIER